MNTQTSDTYQESSQILLGFESLYPQIQLIPKIRFAMETLSFQRDQADRVINDFFVILKTFRSYPMTSPMEALVTAETGKDLFEAVLRFFDHLTYESQFEEIRLVVTNLQPETDIELVKNLVLKFLNEREKHQSYAFCKHLAAIIQENDSFTKVKKILDFFIEIYDDEDLLALKKGYEHFVSLGSALQFFAFLHRSQHLPLLDSIKYLLYQKGQYRFGESLSKGQVRSKMWAVEVLRGLGLIPRSALNLCGWYGVLPYILFENGVEKIVSVDIDPVCEEVAQRINWVAFNNNQFQSVTADICSIDYKNLKITFNDPEQFLEKADLIINTSCEHIENFQDWYQKIPAGQLLLLQSNDFFDCDEHVNCVNSTAEFREQTPMKERLFSGAYPMGKYTRYMVIGYK